MADLIKFGEGQTLIQKNLQLIDEKGVAVVDENGLGVRGP